MVDTLEPYNIVLQDLQNNIPAILREILLLKSDIIVSLIQHEQLLLGEDGDGNEIGTYSRATEIISIMESPKPIRPKVEGEPYNFEWTGKWFKGMKTILKNEKEFEIFSIDGKHKELIKKYGENIVKLSIENNQFVNEQILKPGLYQHFVTSLSFAA